MGNEFFVKRRKGIWIVGLLIILGVLVVGYFIFTVGTEERIFGDKLKLRARFGQVSGLLTSAPVRLEGYGVGTVQEINFVQTPEGELEIEVVFEVDYKVQKYIREDSRCYIGSIGLLGDKYLGVYAGSPESPVVKENDLLPSIEPVEVQEIISRGAKVFDDLSSGIEDMKDIARKVNRGEGTLGLLINDPELYFNMKQLTDAIEDISRGIREGEGTVAALFNERALYDSLVTVSGQLNDLLVLLSEGDGSFQKFVKSDTLYNRLESSAEELENIMANIRMGKGDIGAFLTQKEVHDRLIKLIDELDAFLKELKEHPKKFIKFSIF